MYFDRLTFLSAFLIACLKVHLSLYTVSRVHVPANSVFFALLMAIFVVSGCGNKGPLYLEPDSESRAELEQAEQQINQAAGVTSGDQEGETDQADDDEKKPKKASN